MYRFARSRVLGATLMAGFIFAAGVADAKEVRRYHPRGVTPIASLRPPLTVNKRSFLDPGPVVPVGSESRYMEANTIYNLTPDQNFQRSKFGNEALPRPLEVPGRSGPLFEFWTPGYPY